MTAFVLGRDNPLSLDREKLSQSVACGHNLPVDQRVVLGLLRVAFPRVPERPEVLNRIPALIRKTILEIDPSILDFRRQAILF
jgi:hypothetical protein